MKLLFFIICILGLQTVNASTDTIIVNKDPRLDLLSAKQALINKRTAMLTSNGMYKGYRLQVVSTNNRELAYKIKSDLLTKFPEQKCYTLFQSPNFKVRIGNFLKKSDAENFRTQLSRYYPSGVYIVEDGVEYIPTEEEMNNE